MTHEQIIAELVRIWHSPHLDLILKARLGEVIEALSAEAVHGEWIDIDNYYRMATCSHCLKVTMFEKWGEYTRPYNYCPNCGADMRGEEE